MAKTIGSLSEGFKDITECCICLDTFSNPRMLPCIHTFCHNCLEKTSKQLKWRIREKVPCPLCKQEFNLPEDGVSGIPKNFFMENLIQMTKKANLLQKEEFCDQCQENDAFSLAEVYCIECEEKLCQDCAKYHKRQKQLRNHRVVEVGAETMNVQKKSATAFCKVHTEKPVEMFCDDCNDAICVVCYAVHHQAHKCSELTNAAKIFKVELRSYIDKIDRCLEDSNKQRDALLKTNNNFISEVARVEEEINETANRLIEFVESSKESLILKLSSLKVQTLKGNETQKDEMNSHITILETFKNYCMEVEAKGSNGDICKQINNLKTRSSELQTIHDSFSKQPFSSPEVVFNKSRFGETLKKELNCIGTIQDWKSTANNDPMPIIVNQKHVILPFGELNAKITLDEDELMNGYFALGLFELVRNRECQYIGHKNSNTIFSIPRDKLNNPNSVQEEFVIEQLEALSDMALCTISHSLYAVDSGSDSVWKIDLENRQVIRWLKGVGNPYTLTVCGDGRVVIPRDDQPAKVEVYAPDATLLETIQLPAEILNVFRAFETSTEKFAILNSCIDSNTPIIWQVNKEGQVTHTYAPKNENEIRRDCYIIPCSQDGIEFMVFNCNNYEKSICLDSELASVGEDSDDKDSDDNDDDDDANNDTDDGGAGAGTGNVKVDKQLAIMPKSFSRYTESWLRASDDDCFDDENNFTSSGRSRNLFRKEKQKCLVM